MKSSSSLSMLFLSALAIAATFVCTVMPFTNLVDIAFALVLFLWAPLVGLIATIKPIDINNISPEGTSYLRLTITTSVAPASVINSIVFGLLAYKESYRGGMQDEAMLLLVPAFGTFFVVGITAVAAAVLSTSLWFTRRNSILKSERIRNLSF
ncbi:hypothetical protein [Vibrio sp. D431a]|uniref:hypothetical protein n=1 Tax=Vibrio sp. D431a TaxID=2837388 RepID=UPI0025577BD7|nr:hypothetical protein [Vibrio sp. D431a]MDK9790061.1 hypothetical protein [Vibrio sp. D431a]